MYSDTRSGGSWISNTDADAIVVLEPIDVYCALLCRCTAVKQDRRIFRIPPHGASKTRAIEGPDDQFFSCFLDHRIDNFIKRAHFRRGVGIIRVDRFWARANLEKYGSLLKIRC